MPELRLAPLYPILDASLVCRESLADALGGLARAGCSMVQLRAKSLTARELTDWALEAVSIGRDQGLLVIINDRVDIARISGASGVHLGQDDLSSSAARSLLGDAAIVGLSTHSVEEARAAEGEPVDYVAIGPVFRTPTKSDSALPIGIEGVRAARAVVSKPLVAIGGIGLESASGILRAGASSVAVISALDASVKRGLTWEQAARQWQILGKESK